MRDDLELKLQEEFAFMKQNHVPEERGLYRRWGCECSSGWYDIIYDCCRQIADRYEKEGIEVDFEPTQIKEKWGTLRFYYGYKDAPCGIAAIDFIGSGESLRLGPDPDKDSPKRILREDIAAIVSAAEERSKTTCEWCGDTQSASLRTNLGGRVLTLCDSCTGKYAEKKKQWQKEREEKRKEIFEKLKK